MMAYYTLDQQKRAQEAVQLHQSLRHPSDKALGALLRSPSMINSGISPIDLANARAIWGPCPHCLEGKPLPHEGSHKTYDPGGEPQKPGELLHVDIVYIDGRPRLMAVDHVTGYMSLVIMNSKSKENVIKAYEQIINAYRANLKVVRMISSDHEATLKSCESYLNEKGVKIALRIPYEHEKVAERSVRMLREKMEVTRRELPYNLPPELFDALAVEVVRCCNAIPNAKTVPYSPNELVADTKLNYLTDIQIPFGMPVLVNASQKEYTGSDPAQEIGICLGSANNTKGGIWVYIPGRQQALVRRGLSPMPMTTDIINFMNDWARRKPVKGEEPMIVFKDTPVYSEEDESLGSVTKIKEEEQMLNDFHRFDRLPEDQYDQSINPTTDPEPDIPEDLRIDQPPANSSYKRRHSEISVPPSTSKKSQENNDSEWYREPDEVPMSSSKRRSSVGAPSNPVENLDAKFETAEPKEYSQHLDSKLHNYRTSGRQNKGQHSGRMNLSIEALNYTASYLKEWAIMQTIKETRHSVYATAGSMPIGQALKSNYAELAEQAACDELLQLVKIKSWKYLKSRKDASQSIHMKETPCSMFLRPKHDTKGTFLLWKARLVGGGHRTDPNVYEPFEKNSPTVPLEVAMFQLGNAARQNGNIEVFDIPCAYLNAELDKDKQQLMRIPKNIAALLLKVDPEAKKFVQEDGTILVQILRALYGYPESARLWYEYLSAALRNAGYTVSPSEPCIFRKLNYQTKEYSYVSIYVDDCLHTYNSERLRRELYTGLKNANIKAPKVQQLNLANDVSYLGMNISMKGPKRITISQPGYIKEIIDEYKPKKTYPTPCDENIFKRPVSELEGESVDMTEYLSKLMKLMFLATRTRPDILLTLSALSTKARSPNVHDMKRLDRVIGYLAGTKELGLNMNGNKSAKIHAYFDASWACHSDLKGHTGIIITMGFNGFPLICKSKKQKVVSRSSTEAELIAMFEGLDYILYIRRLAEWMGYNYDNEPITIYQDNTSAMTLAYMGKTSSGSTSKFMDLKYFWIKDYLDTKWFKLEYLPTDAMIADFFASPRTGSVFRSMRNTIMGYEN